MLDTDVLIALIQTHLNQQWLIPRAIDAAADALRHWYRSNAQPLPLDMLALYPHSLALDLHPTHESHMLTRIDIGVPDADSSWHGYFFDVGTFWFETDLNGSISKTTLTIDKTPTDLDRWIAIQDPLGNLALTLPPRYFVNAHGSTLARAIWHEPTSAAHIPASLVAALRSTLASNGWIERAHAQGYAVFASEREQSANDQAWIPDMLTLETAEVQLVFPPEADRPTQVAVTLDVLGTCQMSIGRYYFSTVLDGTYVDDYYTLWSQAAAPPVDAAPIDGIPVDIRIDLGELSPKRQATLRRLIAVVGIDGLHRLMAEARTRVAERAVWNPDPMAPKSARSMLWQMLEQGALDAHDRAFVLGLQPPK